MDRKRNMDEDTKALYDSLIKLRDMTKNDRLECCDEVLELLKYKKEKNKDKEKEIKSYQFDAFLVKAVDKCFKISRDADIALMAFGLLQGYEYDKIVITERRYRYLEESDYLIHNPRSKIKVLDDANEKEKEGLGERLRKGREDTCIIKLAKFLLRQGAIRKFVDEIDNYVESIDGKQFAKLPELNYRRNTYTARNSTKNTDMIDKPQNDDTPQKISDVKDEDSCSTDKLIDEVRGKCEENEQKTGENATLLQEQGFTKSREFEEAPNNPSSPENDEPIIGSTVLDKGKGTKETGFVGEQTWEEPPKSSQQPGDEPKPVITFIYPKLLKIFMIITSGALAVACILFIWMVIPKANEDFTASTSMTEDANNDLESQSNEGENTDNSDKCQDDESVNVGSSDEYQEVQDELIGNIQNRIVNIDEPERYDIEQAFETIMVAIINSPVIGDMTARGLRDLELYGTNLTIGDYASWLDEFIAETDKAMALPLNQHPRGMERWYVYKKGAGNEVSISDEYFVYAGSICYFLESTTVIGIREWESVENWHLNGADTNSGRRAEKNPEQVTHQALVFQVTDTQGNVLALFGFSMLDCRFIVYDPAKVYE